VKAKGKKKKKEDRRFSAVIRILEIVFGAAAVIGLFFFAGYAVDFFTRKGLQPDSGNEFLKFADKEQQLGGLDKNLSEKSSQKTSLSFFETLFQKEDREKPFDKEREKKLLAIRKPKKKGAEESADNNGQGSIANRKKLAAASAGIIYQIQVGSFQNSERAQAFSENLAAKGYEPYIIKFSKPGKGTVYRVRIGRYQNIEDAQDMAKEVEKSERMAVLITTR